MNSCLLSILFDPRWPGNMNNFLLFIFFGPRHPEKMDISLLFIYFDRNLNALNPIWFHPAIRN